MYKDHRESPGLKLGPAVANVNTALEIEMVFPHQVAATKHPFEGFNRLINRRPPDTSLHQAYVSFQAVDSVWTDTCGISLALAKPRLHTGC